MKRILTCILLSLSLLSLPVWANDALLQQAYESQQSHIQVQGEGTVIRLLADDNKGSRHQRFILRLDNRQSILIAHNIDIAPKIPNLAIGDSVQFYGEYAWNKKGGVIHGRTKILKTVTLMAG